MRQREWRQGLIAFVVVAMLFVVVDADAATPACLEANNGTMQDDENGDPAHHVYVFIENDMHDEFRSNTTTTTDDALTQTQLTMAFMQAAEIWNNEARGFKFVFRGYVSIGVPADFCTATALRPALLLNFDENDLDTSNAGYRKIPTCESEDLRQIKVRPAWTEDSEVGSRGDRFANTMMHELGHVIGLDDLGSCTTHQNAKSVMNQCSGVTEGGRHPLSWDKDCATEFNNGASVAYRWHGFTAAGLGGENELDTRYDTREGLGGGHMRSDTNYRRYSFYRDDGVISSSAYGSDGYFSFADYHMDSSHLVDLGTLDVVPFVYTAWEYSASTDGMRISFIDDENDVTPSTKYNPPYAQVVRTDAELDVTPSSDTSYRKCSGTCSGTQDPVLTHLPVIAAWDPVSQNTVHGWVETNSTDGLDGYGRILLSGGIKTSRGHSYLATPTTLTPTLLKLPGSTGTWTYEGRTDVPPAIACADSNWNAPSGGYNCVLAWTDKGIARSPNGNHYAVLYKFFKVGSSQSIVFDPTDTAIRSYSDTASSPALGFFADKMWIGWKTIGAAPQIEVYNSTTAGSWTHAVTIAAANAAGSPFFGYRDGYESLIVWGETE